MERFHSHRVAVGVLRLPNTPHAARPHHFGKPVFSQSRDESAFKHLSALRTNRSRIHRADRTKNRLGCHRSILQAPEFLEPVNLRALAPLASGTRHDAARRILKRQDAPGMGRIRVQIRLPGCLGFQRGPLRRQIAKDVFQGRLADQHLARSGNAREPLRRIHTISIRKINSSPPASEAAGDSISRGDTTGHRRNVTTIHRGILPHTPNAPDDLERRLERAQGVVRMIAWRTGETRSRHPPRWKDSATMREKGLGSLLHENASQHAMFERRDFSGES